MSALRSQVDTAEVDTSEVVPQVQQPVLEQTQVEGSQEVKPPEAMYQALGMWTLGFRIWQGVERGTIDLAALPQVFDVHFPQGSVSFDFDGGDWPLLCRNLVRAVSGTCAIVFDTQMDKAWGEGGRRRPERRDGLAAARVIVHQVRNALAHGPMEPKWQIENNSHWNAFEVHEIGLRLDFRALNGRPFEIEDVRGFPGLASLFDYCLKQVKENGQCEQQSTAA